MSLLFTGGADHKVTVADHSSLTNLQNWSATAWIYATSVPADAAMCWKGGAATGERMFFFFSAGLGNALAIMSHRATAYQEVRATWANFAVEGTDKWLFVAGTASSTTDSDCRLWMGDLTTVAAQPSAYAAQTAGSGTHGDNTGEAQILGNRSIDNRQFDGRIATVGIWDRTLTEAEILSQQYRPRTTSGCVGLWVLGFNGTGTQKDWSDQRNHGTITGATLADHVPIPKFSLARF